MASIGIPCKELVHIKKNFLVVDHKFSAWGDGVCMQKRNGKLQHIYFTLTFLDIRTTNAHIVSSTENNVQVEHSPMHLAHLKWTQCRAIPN